MANDASIDLLRNGRVIPLTKLTPAVSKIAGTFDGGVHYEDNDVCLLGLHGKTSYKNIPAPIVQSKLAMLDGCHIFAGMLQGHFGHFLTESIGRIWSSTYLSANFNSFVYYHRVPGGRLPNFANEIFGLLVPGMDIKIIKEPTIVEQLAVPRQIEKRGMLYGNSVMRDVVLSLKLIKGGSAKRIYVSRSALNLNDGGVLFEALVEQYLEAEVYCVIRPEKMSIHEQVAAYNEAEELIFAEGSALHLYALVARSSQRVFVIWRRKIAAHFSWQIGTFGGPKKIYGIPCIKTFFVPPSGEACGRAEIDFENLCKQLRETGFIAGNFWNSPTVDEVNNEMDRVQRATQRLYVTNSLCC